MNAIGIDGMIFEHNSEFNPDNEDGSINQTNGLVNAYLLTKIVDVMSTYESIVCVKVYTLEDQINLEIHTPHGSRSMHQISIPSGFEIDDVKVSLVHRLHFKKISEDVYTSSSF